MEQLIPAFKTSLFNADAKILLSDFVEVGIDSILEDGIFRDLPIVGTLVGITKTGQRLHDRNLLKQTLLFIKEVNNNTITQKNYDEYKRKILSSPEYAEEELGRVMLILNSTLDDIKSIYIAKLFKAYIDKYILWSDFCEFSDIISRMFTNDMQLMFEIFNNKHINTSSCKIYKLQRLLSLGLITLEANYAVKYNIGTVKNPYEKIHKTELGYEFRDILSNY